MEALPPCITLLTDFGTQDGYVGAMKGVILERCPNAMLIDLTHEIAAQDVLGGAFALRAAARHFPVGTIHVAVVDPGVGGSRKAIGVDDGRCLYLGPDNGLLSLAVGEPRRVYQLDRSDYFRSEISSTFHGRDVFASVAGHLAAGSSLSELATLIGDLEVLALPSPVLEADGWSGQIIHEDRFGNLITNLTADHLEAEPRFVRVVVATITINGLATCYENSLPGDLLALIGSDGQLEIAVRDGSAAKRLGLASPRGQRVLIRSSNPAGE